MPADCRRARRRDEQKDENNGSFAVSLGSSHRTKPRMKTVDSWLKETETQTETMSISVTRFLTPAISGNILLAFSFLFVSLPLLLLLLLYLSRQLHHRDSRFLHRFQSISLTSPRSPTR